MTLVVFRAALTAQSAKYIVRRNVNRTADAARATADAAYASGAAIYPMRAVAYAAYASYTDRAASYAGRAAAYAARPPARATDVWEQISFEYNLLLNSDINTLIKAPIWDDPPAWFISEHVKFELMLKDLGGSWPLIGKWYAQVIGNEVTDPFPVNALHEIASESSEFWGDGDDNPRTPDKVMDDIADRLGWSPDLAVPEPRPGVAFGISQNGRVGISDTGLLTDDDQKEVESVREVLIEALDDLDAGCAGSNAFGFVRPIVSRYQAALVQETVSIDKLYAQGVRLSNACDRIKSEIESEALPEPSVHIGEAFDSVLIIHGPMIMGTERGRELIERARDYSRTKAETEEYKAASTQMAAIAAGQAELLEEDAAQLVTDVNAEIGQGEHPEWSNELAETANFNLLRTIGKITTNPTGAATIAAVTANTLGAPATGQTIATASTFLVEACSAFLLTAEPQLRAMIACTGTDLAWVGSLIDWVKRRRKRK
ncbi:MAG: hypothetical protein AAGG45_03780 [Pseudomonadota bacterium]